MIIGLILLGSVLGLLAATFALLSGQAFLIAIPVYFSTAVLGVIGIPLICAFRPRMHRLNGTAEQGGRPAALHDL